MNTAILHTEVQNFMKGYDKPITELAFAGSPFPDIKTKELLEQIESRNKSKDKLPTFYKTDAIYYPPKVNIEQTSSETTAAYKSELISGDLLIDVTGGFGVDSYYFSKSFETVYHYELNEHLSNIVTHNFKQLGVTNVVTVAADGIIAVLTQGEENHKRYSCIYIDPSRRHNTKGKVFFLKDCEPNVPEHLDELLKKANTILLKTSPMLDISIGLSELKDVKDIHVIAKDNEVKELLWVLEAKHKGAPEVKTVNIRANSQETFQFTFGSDAEPVYSKPLRFLYEPNAAILKSGAFNHMCEAYKLKKLHQHSHLYTSEVLREFPGRRFAIQKVVPYTKNEIKKALTFEKANVATRNFKENVAMLKKKWKLKDGGDIYLFFTTTLCDNKVLLICKKV